MSYCHITWPRFTGKKQWGCLAVFRVCLLIFSSLHKINTLALLSLANSDNRKATLTQRTFGKLAYTKLTQYGTTIISQVRQYESNIDTMNEWATREALQFSNVRDMRQYIHAAQYAKLTGSFPYKINIGAFNILLQLILDQLNV